MRGRQPGSYLGEEHSGQKQQEAQRPRGRSKPARFVQGPVRSSCGQSSKSNGESSRRGAWRGNKTESGRGLQAMVKMLAFTPSEQRSDAI